MCYKIIVGVFFVWGGGYCLGITSENIDSLKLCEHVTHIAKNYPI
jgi:hypothetical protein